MLLCCYILLIVVKISFESEQKRSIKTFYERKNEIDNFFPAESFLDETPFNETDKLNQQWESHSHVCANLAKKFVFIFISCFHYLMRTKRIPPTIFFQRIAFAKGKYFIIKIMSTCTRQQIFIIYTVAVKQHGMTKSPQISITGCRLLFKFNEL